jgi:hypothetical protein
VHLHAAVGGLEHVVDVTYDSKGCREGLIHG